MIRESGGQMGFPGVAQLLCVSTHSESVLGIL